MTSKTVMSVFHYDLKDSYVSFSILPQRQLCEFFTMTSKKIMCFSLRSQKII